MIVLRSRLFSLLAFENIGSTVAVIHNRLSSGVSSLTIDGYSLEALRQCAESLDEAKEP